MYVESRSQNIIDWSRKFIKKLTKCSGPFPEVALLAGNGKGLLRLLTRKDKEHNSTISKKFFCLRKTKSANKD